MQRNGVRVGLRLLVPALEVKTVLPGRKYTPDEILRIALRSKWLIVLPFAVGIIGSQFVARRFLGCTGQKPSSR